MQADKVSMEYLLREKLEKLVQSEIDGRLRGGGDASGSGDARSTAAAMIASLSSSSSFSSFANEGAGGGAVPPPPSQNVDESTRKRLATMQRDLKTKDQELRVALQQLQQQPSASASSNSGADTAILTRLRAENSELKEQLRFSSSSSSSSSSKGDIQSATRTLQAQLDRKNAELETMRERAVSLERLGARASRIQGRCQALVKERKAVQVRCGRNERVHEIFLPSLPL